MEIRGEFDKKELALASVSSKHLYSVDGLSSESIINLILKDQSENTEDPNRASELLDESQIIANGIQAFALLAFPKNQSEGSQGQSFQAPAQQSYVKSPENAKALREIADYFVNNTLRLF